ncbi:unnamed protein product [Didymodactylos carnosus]|uniref:Uncharacterized protein n=1 Tax=Didymodactylos carnosus TaxID=1234261 RepID=A0A8S2MXK0_9BILA|nr:unnamed protein product [Didymodactylos carnosus]CAF3966642.1 unnamed protein product [Didymodactylos carnosus]
MYSGFYNYAQKFNNLLSKLQENENSPNVNNSNFKTIDRRSLQDNWMLYQFCLMSFFFKQSKYVEIAFSMASEDILLKMTDKYQHLNQNFTNFWGTHRVLNLKCRDTLHCSIAFTCDGWQKGDRNICANKDIYEYSEEMGMFYFVKLLPYSSEVEIYCSESCY